MMGSLFSCNRVDDDTAIDFESEGEIIGRDASLCACCGGYQAKFDNREEIFQFSELPEESDIVLSNSNFPIKIRANWTEGVSDACSLFISIEDIELAD